MSTPGKLKNIDVSDMRRMRQAGLTLTRIGELFGVSDSTVRYYLAKPEALGKPQASAPKLSLHARFVRPQDARYGR